MRYLDFDLRQRQHFRRSGVVALTLFNPRFQLTLDCNVIDLYTIVRHAVVNNHPLYLTNRDVLQSLVDFKIYLPDDIALKLYAITKQLFDIYNDNFLKEV